MRKPLRPAIAVVGDLHAASPFGLMPPSFELDAGNVITQNKSQRWLWECWLDFWKFADQKFDVEAVIINGDAPNGINSRDAQTLTVNESDQVNFAVQVMAPIVGLRKKRPATKPLKLYATRGTGFHAGRAGAREETIMRELGTEADDAGKFARWALWLDWHGKLVYATHHASTAPVYPLTPFAREMNNALMRHAANDWPLPDIDLRAHGHKCTALQSNTGRWMARSPAWQFPTEFAYKVAAGDMPDFGGLIVWLDDDGDLQVKRRLYNPPKPHIDQYQKPKR